MNIESVVGTAITVVTQVGLRIVGAFVLWLVGRWLIRLVIDVVSRALVRQQVDVTLSRYVQASLTVLLNIALIVSLLGFFGIETTTFAALMAAGGVAIGLA